MIDLSSNLGFCGISHPALSAVGRLPVSRLYRNRQSFKIPYVSLADVHAHFERLIFLPFRGISSKPHAN